MKYHDFMDFLSYKHADTYGGTDDGMSDDFENWMACLDPQEYIDYADQYVAELFKQINELVK